MIAKWGVVMKQIIAAFCALIYFGGLINCFCSLVKHGMFRNFALIWIIPFLIQLICYIVVIFKKSFSYKLAVFVTVFGFVLSLPIFLLYLPMILWWNIVLIVVSLLSLSLCFNKRK